MYQVYWAVYYQAIDIALDYKFPKVVISKYIAAMLIQSQLDINMENLATLGDTTAQQSSTTTDFPLVSADSSDQLSYIVSDVVVKYGSRDHGPPRAPWYVILPVS